MEPQLVDALRGRRAETKARWIALLHIEPVTTPLAHPGTLAFMIDDSLDAVYAVLAQPDPHAVKPVLAADSQNPFIAYFLAGKQALLEALVLAQAEKTDSDRNHREAAVAELTAAIEMVIGGEVDAFGQVCHPAPALAGSRFRSNGGNGHANEFAG